MFTKKTLRNIDLKDKRVLLRTDFNVPIENGVIVDDYRIKKALPTIRALIEQKCQIIICSHLGRPDGKVVSEMSLQPVAERLSKLIHQEVHFTKTPPGEDLMYELKAQESQVILLENLRFYPEEEANDATFAKHLASLGDIFVQDGFAVVHRAHASTVAVTQYLPSIAGLLVEAEVKNILKATQHPKQPLVVIVGGAKIETKLPVLKNLIRHTKRLIIGGAMANTFLLAKEIGVGKSLVDKNEVKTAQKIMDMCIEENVELILPLIDVAVGDSVDEKAKRRNVEVEAIKNNDIILDFGTKSIESAIHNLEGARTVIWNGPLGMVELDAFAKGSKAMAEALASLNADVIVGGGDTEAFIEKLDLMDAYTLVSTGGGASLELMAGNTLPAIEALQDK